MTPTETAGVAVAYAISLRFLVYFLVYNGLTRENLFDPLRYAGTMVGALMMMVFIVMIGSQFLVYETIPALARELIYSASEHPVMVLLMINLVGILIGMLMDDISGLLLSAPLLLPIVQSVGMEPVHLRAVLGVNLGMANITPPTAQLLYLGARATDTPVNTMLKPTLLLLAFAWLPTLMITTFIPQVVLWLPNLVFG